MKNPIFLKVLAAGALAAMSSGAVCAQNVLETAGWYPENAAQDNKSAFYASNWKCISQDGSLFDEETAPYSVFSPVTGTPRSVVYNGSSAVLYGNTDGFPTDDSVAVVLSYPSDNGNMAYYLPINIPEEKIYTFSCGFSFIPEGSGNAANSIAQQFNCIIFTFAKDPFNQINFDSTEGLTVKDSEGNALPATAASLGNINESTLFNKELQLTTDTKYMVIYGPSKVNSVGHGAVVLANMKLEPDGGFTSVESNVYVDEAQTLVYDLNGNTLNTDLDALPSGFYIVRQGAKTTKVLK